jgi:hypothetical protein
MVRRADQIVPGDRVSRLAQLQDALSTIVTDGEVEEVYRRTPGEAIVAVAEVDARDTLAGLETSEVLRYARSLRRKRWEDVAATIPLSVQVIGGLQGRYYAWLREHPAQAHDTLVPPGATEALRALMDLVQDLGQDPGEAPWAAELLVFEVLGACSRADDVSRGLQARYPIHRIADEVRAGLIPIDPPVEPHAYAFGDGGVRMRKLG